MKNRRPGGRCAPRSDGVRTAGSSPRAFRKLLGAILIGAATLFSAGVVLVYRQSASASGEDAASRPRLPADFEPVRAVLVGTDQMLTYAPETLTETVRALSDVARVALVSPSTAETRRTLDHLADRGVDVGKLSVIELPVRSRWVRDYAPAIVRMPDGAPAGCEVDYLPHVLPRGAGNYREVDNLWAGRFCRGIGMPLKNLGLMFEWGNLVTNGQGLAVSTRLVLDENRSRMYTRAEIAGMLKRRLGITDWICLPRMEGDPVNHADGYVAFLAPDHAVVADVDPAVSQANARALDTLAAALAEPRRGQPALSVHRVPLPRPVNGWPRSYTNVLMVNGTLLVPTWSDVDPAVQQGVLDLYARVMPDWRVVPINCDGLRDTGGALRCISMQIPTWAPRIESVAVPAR